MLEDAIAEYFEFNVKHESKMFGIDFSYTIHHTNYDSSIESYYIGPYRALVGWYGVGSVSVNQTELIIDTLDALQANKADYVYYRMHKFNLSNPCCRDEFKNTLEFEIYRQHAARTEEFLIKHCGNLQLRSAVIEKRFKALHERL